MQNLSKEQIEAAKAVAAQTRQEQATAKKAESDIAEVSTTKTGDVDEELSLNQDLRTLLNQLGYASSMAQELSKELERLTAAIDAIVVKRSQG